MDGRQLGVKVKGWQVAYLALFNKRSQGDTHSVKPFTNSSSNPRDFVTALGKLESAAPDAIQSDVKTLKQLFEKIDKDPSQAFSASMSGLGAEDSVNKYTAQHCKE